MAVIEINPLRPGDDPRASLAMKALVIGEGMQMMGRVAANQRLDIVIADHFGHRAFPPG